MKKLILVTVFILNVIQSSFAQDVKLEGIWVLDNIELSDFDEMAHAFTEAESFFAHFLDKTNKLDLSKPSISLVIGGESYTYDVMLNKKELHLSSSNTIYIKKNSQPVETKIALGETIFKIRKEGDKLILFRKNETFYERYTFIAAN
jgi:hypothetical protein